MTTFNVQITFMKTEIASNKLSEVIVSGIQEVKGKNISVLDLSKLENAICDYFVICNGDSSTQVESIARSVEKETKKILNEKPWHSEGVQNAEWILLDYVNVVVHIFHTEKRDFYNLEELWGDAPKKDIPNLD